jgi:hypothetical protein
VAALLGLAAVEQAFREWVRRAPDALQAAIKLDVASAGPAKVQQLDPRLFPGEAPPENEKTRRLLGDSPIYLAILPGAAFLAWGKGGLVELKEIIAAPPRAAPLYYVEVDMARFLRLSTPTPAESHVTFEWLGTFGISVEAGPSFKSRYDGFGAFVGLRIQAAGKDARPPRAEPRK